MLFFVRSHKIALRHRLLEGCNALRAAQDAAQQAGAVMTLPPTMETVCEREPAGAPVSPEKFPLPS